MTTRSASVVSEYHLEKANWFLTAAVTCNRSQTYNFKNILIDSENTEYDDPIVLVKLAQYNHDFTTTVNSFKKLRILRCELNEFTLRF